MAGVTGLEPATSGVTGRRSNQLSYTPAALTPRAGLLACVLKSVKHRRTPLGLAQQRVRPNSVTPDKAWKAAMASEMQAAIEADDGDLARFGRDLKQFNLTPLWE